MKKLFTTAKYKKYNTLKSLRAVMHYQKRAKCKYNKQKYSNINIGGNIGGFPRPTTVNVQAPKNYSLINNTESTISFFNYIHEQLRQGIRVLFDISKIDTLTTDAIAVQIAKIKDEKFHCNGNIKGNAPDDVNLKKLFLQSGFYEYVNTRGVKPKNEKIILIHEITDNKVEPDIAKNACLLGLKHTFGNEDIFEPLYDILIEVMQNTNNHAGITRGKYDWWLHVYNHPDSSKTSYTFLDLGVGIFESIPVKSFKRDFLERLGLKSNLDLVPKLFAGEIKSRTSRPERGKGIPQIYECSQEPTFDKFILISNDVYADLKTSEYKLIKTKFDGTLFYWEIINNNTYNGN